MRKLYILIPGIFLLFSDFLFSQEISIGKDSIDSWNSLIHDGYSYEQYIYKQPWIHAEGAINKIAFYYFGDCTDTMDVDIYMGHTTKTELSHNNWVPYSDLSLAYSGIISLPGYNQWVEIPLDEPFNYNNSDNLVIAIDKNSLLNCGGYIATSEIDEDINTMQIHHESYNFDPEEIFDFYWNPVSNNTPNIKLYGSLTESSYLYVYGKRNNDITTNPDSSITISVENNVSSFSATSDSEWLVTSVDNTNNTFTGTVNTANSDLGQAQRTATVVLNASGAENDTVYFHQYQFESQMFDHQVVSLIDFDNDGDMDIVGDLLIGVNNGDDTYSTYDLSVYTDPIMNGRTFWEDFNNDGYIDFIVCGEELFHEHNGEEIRINPIKLFQNDSLNSFTEVETEIKPFRTGDEGFFTKVSWADYNNDGLKDFLIAGVDTSGLISAKIYTNLGQGNFEDSEIPIHDCAGTGAEWGDYNNDGLIDLVISGGDNSGNSNLIIYKNQGNGIFENIEANLMPVLNGNVDWGDFDNDGDLDLLVSGNNMMSNSSIIYINEGDDNFTIMDFNFENLNDCGGLWVDFDNDGDLDIVRYGVDGDIGAYLIRYNNDGSGGLSVINKVFFPEIPWSYSTTPISLCNYNSDGDMDFMICDVSNILGNRIYRNNLNTDNALPSKPVNLKASNKANGVYLSWAQASDKETPGQSLKYNIRIGSAPGSCDILAPNADVSNGNLKIHDDGFLITDTFKIITDLPLGTYYWSVQSVDNMYGSSGFSEESTFEIEEVFSKFNPGIMELGSSSGSWGDYDNDGDLDILIKGGTSEYGDYYTKILKNMGDTLFEEVNTDIVGLVNGVALWIDYDNDNDLDIFLTGKPSENDYGGSEIVKIYRNDGGDNFVDINLDINDITQFSNAAWGDYDNDGKMDFIVSGRLYRNNGSDNFTVQDFNIPETDFTALKFGDIDNDMDLDLMFSGQWIDTKLYINDHSEFNAIDSGFITLNNGSIEFADYDNDGNLDILIGGTDTIANNHCVVYKNNSNYSFTKLNTVMRGFSYGQSHWGDFNNDGFSDILSTGLYGKYSLEVYENLRNDQFDISYQYETDHTDENFAKWGDFNNDGNLDFFKSGNICGNNYEIEPKPIDKVENLEFNIKGFDVIFQWDKIINEEIGDCYSYNLRIGSSSGGTDVMSPMADVETGYRLIPAIGNVQKNDSWIIKNLTAGKTYYWSVQAIDNSFAGGPWAEEQTFTMPSLFANFKSDTVCQGNETHFTDLSQSPDEDIVSWEWDFGDGGVSSEQNPAYTYVTSGTFNVSLTINTATHTQTVTKEVIVCPTPIADFGFEIISLGQHTPFTNLTDTNSAVISSWQWDFGDGNLYNDAFPEFHKYSKTGNYSVALTVESNNGCSDYITKTVAVCKEALPKPELYVKGPEVLYLSCSNDTAQYYQWFFNDQKIAGAKDYIYVSDKSFGTYRVEISTDGLCYTPSDDVNYGTTAIETFDPFANLKIYPNPTPGVFTIEMDNNLYGELITRIFSQNAVEILNIKFDKKTKHFKAQVDLSGQGHGIYIIAFMLDKYKAERKLVVE